jgi:hypothetical protein
MLGQSIYSQIVSERLGHGSVNMTFDHHSHVSIGTRRHAVHMEHPSARNSDRS